MWQWWAWALLGAITLACIGTAGGGSRAAGGGWSMTTLLARTREAPKFGCKSFGSIEQMLTTHSEVQAASVAVPRFDIWMWRVPADEGWG